MYGLADFALLSVSNLLTIVIFLVALVVVYTSTRKPSGIPPGPPLTLPIIGDIPILLRGNVVQTFQKLRRSYGDIFSFYLGRELVVVLNGQQTIRKAAAKNVFSGRPTNVLTNVGSKGRGILLASGSLWRSQRLFIHKFLQSPGLDGNSFEDIIFKESRYFVETLKAQNGEPYNPADAIYASFANISLGMTVGHRRAHGDDLFRKIRQILAEATRLHIRISVFMNCVPLLQHFPGDPLKLQKIKGWEDVIGSFATSLYNDHKISHTDCKLQGACPKRDLMDVFICEMVRSEGTDRSTYFTLDQLKVLVGEMIGAASESPTTFLRWAILYLIHFPGIKSRLQNDIGLVLGKRQPRFKDMTNLPYVEAFICEVLRMANVVPFAMPHACFADSSITWEGFTIPKGCTVVLNQDSVLKDPEIFQNPEAFDPARFLDESGKIIRPKGFIPFGTGRRICPGENIAWIEMFLFLTLLLQEFDFSPKDPDMFPELEGVVDLAHYPKPFEVRAISRKADSLG